MAFLSNEEKSAEGLLKIIERENFNVWINFLKMKLCLVPILLP